MGRAFERIQGFYEDLDEGHAETIRCLRSCTESSDSNAVLLGFGRQGFAAPLLPYPGYATEEKRGADRHLLIVMKDETDFAPGTAAYDVTMNYLNADGSAFAPPDSAQFREDDPSGFDPTVAGVLRTALYDASHYGWFDQTEASIVAFQLEQAEASGR